MKIDAICLIIKAKYHILALATLNLGTDIHIYTGKS